MHLTTPAIPAASVLLARHPGSPEVFLVRRGDHLRFFGSFWAFPGGKLAPEDEETPVPGSDRPDRLATAARELFEETGVLIARAADGSFARAGPELDELRRRTCAGQVRFVDLLGQLQLSLHADDFTLIGDITTPPFVQTRFDTTFFVATLPPGQQAEVWPGELAEGTWADAAAMLDRWTSGACLLSPPSAMTLEAIRGRPVAEAPARLGPLLRQLAAGTMHPIYFSPAVLMVPLRSQALPPSSYTNAFLVGQGPIYLLDPGPVDPEEQQRLFDVLDARAGPPLSAVVLTHHHADHIGAAAACAARYGVPVWAHPWTAAALRGKVEVTHLIHDGDRLDLGPCPDGRGSWHLEAIHTPGHAPGHLAFHEPRYRLLFAGDMISMLSSIVIAPPEGNLDLYLGSLRRLQGYDCRLLLPAHGGASSRPQDTLREALAHRAKREAQLLAALGAEPRTIAELTPELYRGTPEALMRLARLQMLAGLLKLQRDGRVEADGQGLEAGWRLSRL